MSASRISRLRTSPAICLRRPLLIAHSSTSAAVAPSSPPSTDTHLPPSPRNELPPATRFPRLAALRATPPPPLASFLTDTFNRPHTYLRLSLTERCNLRCLYCMPESGVPLSPPPHLLSTPELLELSSLFVGSGITKIRLTGGEPTVRRDLPELVAALGEMRARGLRDIAMTSNGVALAGKGKLQGLVDAGLNRLNLSLDTLVPAKFEFMTRRKGLDRVLRTLDMALEMPALESVKLNVVVMKGVNEDEMHGFVDMTGDHEKLEVRFIEYMPFDGNRWSQGKMVPYADMVSAVRSHHPEFDIIPKQLPNDTAKTWKVPGYKGKVGFITSMTENFCGTCNRLRVTSDGNIKVCLFGKEEVSLRDVMRKYRDRDAEVGAGSEEMREELREVIGLAVERKEVGHKPAEELGREKGGRPMILIENRLPFPPQPRPGPLAAPLCPLPHSPAHQPRLYSSSPRPSTNDTPLPHLTSQSKAHIIPITHKPSTLREARAQCTVSFTSPHTLARLLSSDLKKGDALSVARLAGLLAAKLTPQLILLAHPIPVTGCEVDVRPVAREEAAGGMPAGGVQIEVRVQTEGKTGCEMEALTAAAVAGLNVVDMVKGVDRGVWLRDVKVLEKTGGVRGDWRRDEAGVAEGG